jgi:hypothetical protein
MLQRIRFTVTNYKALQGLAVAAYGLGLLLFTLWRAWLLWKIFPSGLDGWNFLLDMVVGGGLLAACVWLGLSYYRRTFGLINVPDRSEPVRVSGWGVFCFILFILGMWIDVNLHPHVSCIVLACAAALVVRWHCLGRTLHYYLILAILMIGVSFLPFLDPIYAVFSQSKSDQFSYLLSAVVGCLLIIVGVCDHLALIHNMRKVRGMMQENAGLISTE